MTLDELNAMPSAAAKRELERCCGSARWATAVSARRPFRSVNDLHGVAEEAWWSLDESAWLEAFSHHARIGGRAGGWAKDEQSGMRGAASLTTTALARRNQEYERKFGHVFLICATGMGADEMLAHLTQRISNDPATELKTAAGEQAKITRLRLEKLLSPSLESSKRR